MRLDGIQVAETHRSILSLSVTPGRHTLSAEVNSAYHQEFIPPLKVMAAIRVVDRSGAISYPACAGVRARSSA